MPCPEHLKILTSGVAVWNAWRGNNPGVIPQLEMSNLSWAVLAKCNLRSARLTRSILNGANLSGADLSEAHLCEAYLVGTDLREANLSNTDLRDTDFLTARLNRANLSGANLSGSGLTSADFSNSTLDGADFRRAMLSGTALIDVNLSETRGLESILHRGPSTISIGTLYKSHGRIPDTFLRDVGVPDEIIEIARSLRTGPPIQWDSCFISYSSKDEEFAKRLHARMREANMRVWYAPEHLQGGKKLHEQLFAAIQIHDRLLIVLSEHSIQSEWVMTEIRKAREVERRENRRKLFPVRLVDFDTLRNWSCFDADAGKDLAVEVREYFIPDFSNWKNHDAFEKEFNRLQQDLKTEGRK
jgi:uncharacterized protein YjbI with pentapeptide repeats